MRTLRVSLLFRTAQMDDRWRKYLRDDERLLWTGEPGWPRRLKRVIVTIIPLGILGLWTGWYALSYSDVTEACGEAPTRSCFKDYYLAWTVFVLCSGIVAVTTIRFAAWSVGLLTFSYAITDKRALSLTTGVYRSFRSVYLDLLEPGRYDLRRPFGEVDFGLRGVSFVGLSDAELETAFSYAQTRTLPQCQ